jgi:hypothetical protein
VSIKLETSATTSKIEAMLAALQQYQIVIPRPAEVRDYLLRYPEMTDRLPVVCATARKHFPLPAQLSLELYRDPEIDDQYLTLYVRQRDYDGSLMEEIDKVCEECRPTLEWSKGRLLVTTDFGPPE